MEGEVRAEPRGLAAAPGPARAAPRPGNRSAPPALITADADPGAMRQRLADGALIALVCCWSVLRYGILTQPILGDRALILYNYQAIHRGEPIYLTTSAGYPPFSGFLASGVMRIGEMAGMPSYLSPRYAGALVLLLASVALYAVLRRASGSRLTGLVGGVALAGFGELSAVSATNLEPKALIVLFLLLAALLVQRGRWLLAGTVAAVAMTTYFGAVVIVIAVLVAAAISPAPTAAMARLAAGGVLGSVPTLAYLLSTGSIGAFLRQTVQQQASNNAVDGGTLFRGANVVQRQVAVGVFAPETFVFALGLIGFGVFAARTLRDRRAGDAFGPRWGGIPAATLLMPLWILLDADGGLDLVPVLPLVAIWAAWALGSVGGARRRWLVPATGLALVTYLHLDSFFVRPAFRLDRQLELVRGLPAGQVAAVGAAEMYVLREAPAPVSLLEVTPAFTTRAWRSGGGCGRFVEALNRAEVVVVRERPRPDCPIDGGALPGYRHRGISFPLRSPRRRYFGGESLRSGRWSVYTRRPPAPPGSGR